RQWSDRARLRALWTQGAGTPADADADGGRGIYRAQAASGTFLRLWPQAEAGADRLSRVLLAAGLGRGDAARFASGKSRALLRSGSEGDSLRHADAAGLYRQSVAPQSHSRRIERRPCADTARQGR